MHVFTCGRSASTYDIIQDKTLSRKITTNKLYLLVNIDNESKYFSNPRKHNNSYTEPSANNILSDQFHLGFDTL